MNVIELPLKAIKPYKRNPRKNDKAVEYVANSIRQFGFKVPIVIDANYEIVCGHTRWKAAKVIGLESVPCIIADDLNEDQIKAFRLADNKTAEMADWDFDLLEMEFNDIDPELFDMSDFGFFQDEETEDKAPTEITEDDFDESTVTEAVCKRGQVWQLGDHRLMCGDSTSAEDVARLMNGEKADMVFTDPPYNVAIGSKNAFLNSVQPSGRCCEDIAGDKGMTDEEIGETLWKPAFMNMRDNSKDCCSIYVTMPQGGTHMMMMMMMSASWQVKHELMWEKNSPTFSMGRLDYDYQHEPICYGWNKSHVFYGKGEQTKSIWKFDKPRKCDLHPTMKPVSLIVNALLNSSKQNDIILDVFGGSGSTLIACEQLDRRCFMMELDPHYCDVIIKRWENLTGQTAELLED